MVCWCVCERELGLTGGMNAQVGAGRFEGVTTNNADFRGEAAERTAPMRPKDSPIKSGRFYGTTEAQKAFVEYPVEAPKPRAKAVYKPNNLPFEGNTEAQRAFTPKKAERTRAVRPKSRDRPTAKFDAHTTAQGDFVKHPVQKRQPIKMVRKGVVNGGKFVDETEAKAAFPAYKVVPPAQREPEKWKPSGLKFHGTSENRAQFTGKEAQRAVVTKMQDNLRVDSGAKFNEHTTARDDFPEYHVERQQPIRPKSRERATGKFEGVSEAQKAFVEYPVEAPKPRAKAVYKPNNLPFEGNTEAQRAFTPKQAEPTRAVRPKSRERPTAKFDAHTTAQGDFVKHPVQKRQPVKVVRAGRVNGGKFYGETEANAAFKEYQVVPPAQREPEKWKPSGLKFHGTSENHAQFTDKEAQRAVATRMQDNLRVDSRAKFNEHTTARDDFQRYRVERQRPIRPKSRERATGKFQGVTEAQKAYIAYEIQQRERVAARAREDHIAMEAESRDFVTERFVRCWCRGHSVFPTGAHHLRAVCVCVCAAATPSTT